VTTLVVAAHPDDEVLGCGATMARLAEEGESVQVLILGEGATSRADRRADAAEGEVDDLQRMSEQAAAVLGVAGVRHAGLPDNRFDAVDLLDIVKRIEQVVDEIRPSVVYCQHGGDLNIDHALTFRAVLTATRPMPGGPVDQVLAFEVSSSTEWAFQQFGPPFHPNVFVDVSSSIDRKLAALECYASELRPAPHPRSLEAVAAMARHRGAEAGCAAAEAFSLVRWVR
jgi:LmbE family N-acetylglucosaminyl deacetylase